MDDHTQDAIEHLQKAKESLALSEHPQEYAKISSVKRTLEIEEEQ